MKYIERQITNKDYSTISVNQLVKHLNLDVDLVDNEFLESILQSSIDWVENRIQCYITPTTTTIEAFEFVGDTILIEHRGFNNVQSFQVNSTPFSEYTILRKEYSTIIKFNNPISVDSKVEIIYESGLIPNKGFIQATIIQAADLFDIERSNYSAGLTDNKVVTRLLNLI